MWHNWGLLLGIILYYIILHFIAFREEFKVSMEETFKILLLMWFFNSICPPQQVQLFVLNYKINLEGNLLV